MNIFLDEDGKIRKKEKCKIKSHFLLFFFSFRRQQLSFHLPLLYVLGGGVSNKRLKILCNICSDNFSTLEIAFENVSKFTVLCAIFCFHMCKSVSMCERKPITSGYM